MLRELFQNRILLTIFIIGAALRLTLFFTSPPNNAYDDHLEVIQIYSEAFERPAPFQCWECYQPPTYYIISGALKKTMLLFGTTNVLAWKTVQLINPLLSIVVLILFLKILTKFKIPNPQKILYFSFLAVFPRDILTSAMIGNDYLLIFSSMGAFYYYIKYLDIWETNEKGSKKYFFILCLFVLLGSLTKQHGLLLLIFPGYFVFKILSQRKHRSQKILLSVFTLITIISLSDEIWKFSQTGELLVSNQHYFNYAQNQFPGNIEKVEFGTLRIIKLFEHPFISEHTAASFPTEIFARSFFDYEWRFLSPNITTANFVGRIGYSLGILWGIYFLLSTALGIKTRINDIKTKNLKLRYFVPLIIGLLFLTVPVIQTLRFPYFSSMKAMFILPGVFILIAIHSLLTKKIKYSNKGVLLLTGLNLLYGFLLILTIFIYLEMSLDQLHGPLWNIPN